MKLHDIDALLKKSLPEKRYVHSVNVMHEAAVLAEYHGVNEKKACLTGLLHDCGREFHNSEIVLEAQKRGLKLSNIEIEQPVLVHAHLGVIIAQEKYDVQDEEVLKAIKEHTTGNVGMSELSMVVFLTDLIEPERKQKGVERLRHIARKNLHAAMIEALSLNIRFLLQTKRFIHPDCIACWNDLKARYGKEI